MRWRFAVNLLPCLIVLHAPPDGQDIDLDTDHISLVRRVEGFKHHVAHGTNTIITVGGARVGVIEDKEDVEAAIKDCRDHRGAQPDPDQKEVSVRANRLKQSRTRWRPSHGGD